MGLHAALDYLDAIGLEAIAAHDSSLSAYAYEKLARMKGARLFGPKQGRSGVLSFLLRHIHAHDVVTVADQAGSRCGAGIIATSR